MFVRIVNFSAATDIDAGVRYVRDEVTPVLRAQHGFRGVTVTADRAQGHFAVLSLWDSAAAREASESALAKNRDEGKRVLGGEISIENYEQLLWEIAEPPVIGTSALQTVRTSMDPRKVDDNFEFFRTVVVPQMKPQPGFQAVRNLANRDTGEGMVGTVWTDSAALAAAAAEAPSRRERAIARGVTFGEESRREILFAERN